MLECAIMLNRGQRSDLKTERDRQLKQSSKEVRSMNERIGFSLIFIFLIIIQSVCVVLARRSSRSIGSSVAMLCCSLILPVTGNLVIIASTNRILSLTGYYIYMLGMDMVLFALIRFTDRYCQGIGDGTQKPTVVYAALEFDCVQLLLNIVFKHAFEVERITVENAPYYRLVPHFGQTISLRPFANDDLL